MKMPIPAIGRTTNRPTTITRILRQRMDDFPPSCPQLRRAAAAPRSRRLARAPMRGSESARPVSRPPARCFGRNAIVAVRHSLDHRNAIRAPEVVAENGRVLPARARTAVDAFAR